MNFIVTTSIYSPSKALLAFAAKKGWQVIVVGDLKTPHQEYVDLPSCIYLSPEYQEQTWPALSGLIGWNKIMRRTFGLLEAYSRGAEVIATVDDDNIPYESWGEDLYVGQTIDVDCFEPENSVFDPLSVTEYNNLWHRGYPLELVKTKNRVIYKGKIKRRVLVQANLWDGDPDIDAVERIAWQPTVKFESIKEPYCSNRVSPFNSQNTFLSREVIPYYLILPFVGRMDDIWPSYILQKFIGDCVVYDRPTVYQDRNPQNLVTNMKNEIIGYEHTLKLIEAIDWMSVLPTEAQAVYREYMAFFK